MFKSIVFAAALAASAVAQSTSTVNMFVADSDTHQYEASVISADASLTTYAWACVSGPSCIASYTGTMIYGSSTQNIVAATSLSGVVAQATQDCKIDPSVSASCDVTIIVSTDGFSTSTATSTILSPITASYTGVTITGGLEKLASATSQGSSSSGSSPSTSSGSSSTASSSASSSASANSAPNTRAGDVTALVILPAFAAVAGGLLLLV